MKKITSSTFLFIFIFFSLPKGLWANPFRQEIPPLIQTSWDQGPPYNIAFPYANKSKKIRPFAGCSVIAVAQILAYYQYGIDIDWSSLPRNLKKSKRKDQRNLSKFLYHVATALNSKVEYVDDAYELSTGGREFEESFRNDFHYKKKRREFYSIIRDSLGMFFEKENDWKEIIYHELNEGRPILYLAQNKKGAGHTFIVDGYNKKGLFHINWGWGGFGDGYYDLYDLKPDPKNSSEWNYNHQIFVGLEPKNGYAKKLLNQKLPLERE